MWYLHGLDFVLARHRRFEGPKNSAASFSLVWLCSRIRSKLIQHLEEQFEERNVSVKP